MVCMGFTTGGLFADAYTRWRLENWFASAGLDISDTWRRCCCARAGTPGPAPLPVVPPVPPAAVPVAAPPPGVVALFGALMTPSCVGAGVANCIPPFWSYTNDGVVVVLLGVAGCGCMNWFGMLGLMGDRPWNWPAGPAACQLPIDAAAPGDWPGEFSVFTEVAPEFWAMAETGAC